MKRPRRRRVYVNRDVEKTIFSDMVDGVDSAHVFLVQAESGMGKTVLLEEFWAMSAALKRGRVNLKQPDYEVVDILDDLVYQLGTPHFPDFRHQTQALALLAGKDPAATSDRKQLFRLIQDVAGRCKDEDVRRNGDAVTNADGTCRYRRAARQGKRLAANRIIDAGFTRLDRAGCAGRAGRGWRRGNVGLNHDAVDRECENHDR